MECVWVYVIEMRISMPFSSPTSPLLFSPLWGKDQSFGFHKESLMLPLIASLTIFLAFAKYTTVLVGEEAVHEDIL